MENFNKKELKDKIKKEAKNVIDLINKDYKENLKSAIDYYNNPYENLSYIEYQKLINSKKYDCYFYNEEHYMEGNIPYCNYFYKNIFSCYKCKKYIKSSKVFDLIKFIADNKSELNQELKDLY